jgi:hypothetical protein
MQAKRTRGACANCGHVGVLPGRDDEDQPTCRTCSGIRLNVDCVECGAEAELYRGGRCLACELRKEATLLLSADRVPSPAITKLIDALAAMPRPNSGLTWIRQPHIQRMLTQFGQSGRPITHQTLDELKPSRTVEYFRALLIEHKALTPRDRFATEFDRWVATRPNRILDDSVRSVFAQYLRWHQKRRLQKAAAASGVTPRGVFLTAKQTTTVAIGFLNFLAERDRPLPQLNQHDVDEWFGNGPSTRHHATDFLYWAISHHHAPRVDLPRRVKVHANPLGDEGRVALLGRIFADDATPLGIRVAGGIILLFGQPVGRTVSLRTNAVRATDDGELGILFAQDWVPVPQPFAILLDDWLDSRTNLQTAAHVDSPWLFPGGSPGEHLAAGTVSTMLARHGISARAAREAAWQDFVHTIPPALLANAFGVTTQAAETYARTAGARYARYAALHR